MRGDKGKNSQDAIAETLTKQGESEYSSFHLNLAFAFTRFHFIHRCFNYKVKPVELMIHYSTFLLSFNY